MNEIKTGMRGMAKAIDDNFKELGKMFMPVGFIYISANNTNPATLFGFGTWQPITGKVLVGVDVNDTDFDVAGKTGGAKTHTLTVAQLATHTHVQDAHNHTQNAHTHVQDSHNHTQQAHNHTQNAHNHGVTGGGGDSLLQLGGTLSGNMAGFQTGTSMYNNTGKMAAQNPIANTTATNNATTAVNNATTATNQNTTATNNATTATNQNTGGGQAHNNMQPYETAYMWKRTA
jgi:microcystin-dependent protein